MWKWQGEFLLARELEGKCFGNTGKQGVLVLTFSEFWFDMPDTGFVKFIYFYFSTDISARWAYVPDK